MNKQRRFRRLLAGLFALALVAAACGSGGSSDDASSDTTPPDDASATTEADGDTEPDDGVGADETADGSDALTGDAAEATRGGTLRVGLQTEADSLNPTNTALNQGPLMILTAVLDTLVVVDDEGQWYNNYTESWTPNDDFSSWEVKLREGIMFSDGNVMDADAVIRTIEATLADPLISLAFKPVFDPDNPLEKVGDLTFRINASGPSAALPYFFAEQLGMVGSPAWLDARDADPSLDQMPIGAGPFVIEERTQDLRTVLVRNDNWWRTDQEIWLDSVEILPVVQGNSRTDQFLAGDLDITHGTDHESLLRLREETEGIVRVEDNSGQEFTILMNAGREPFDDIRVRQAATHAFPKSQYMEFITEGAGLEADSLFSSDTPWHAPGLEQLDDMPDLAQPLVDSYCADFPDNCTDGRVDIEYQTDGPSLSLERTATVVADAWAPFFNVETQIIPNDIHIQEVPLGLYDAATWRYFGFADPDLDAVFFDCSTIGGLSINFARNCDEERDALMRAQRETQDFDERYEIWTQIQENLRDSYALIVAEHTTWMVASHDYVGGLCDATTPDGDALPCQLRGIVRFPQIFLAG